jgi:rhodanese-related sulfurtransferase
VKRFATIAIVAGLAVLTACGSDESAADADSASAATSAPAADTSDTAAAGFATISADAAAAVLADAPDDLVILDVRTPQEYAEGHLEGAVLVDFYDADFADQLAALDPDVPYLVYCRSGNRSGQTLPLMEQLGFASASDIDGGIIAWADAGLPIVTG